MSEVAVVLMAYGSPDRLEHVPAYYADIRGGRPIRPELLENLVERYRRLGIEDANPLNAITEETRTMLERELGVPVFTGMKHWQPRIAAATEAALATGASTIVGLVLAPHYSRGSVAGYRSQVEEALANGPAELVFVDSWHDDPGLVALLADRVRGTKAHVVFTAHSLPARVLEGGDPYEDQLLETSRLVAEAAGVDDWSFSYQSESATGEPWLQPDILDHLAALRAKGVASVLVCPVGFVSDHLEIRWDLDVEAAERAAELGMRYDRMEMPNADPGFIRVLAGIVRRTAALPSSA
jgi:protoporphyrin/coproporphyrin ferrochelatase